MQEDQQIMNFILSAFFTLITAVLLWSSFSLKNDKNTSIDASFPTDDRNYWKQLRKKFLKSGLIGAVGALLTALALCLKMPVPAEVGCITLLAAFVFALAFVSKKTDVPLCDRSVKLQKKYKLILLLLSLMTLLLTQFVFNLFI